MRKGDGDGGRTERHTLSRDQPRPAAIMGGGGPMGEWAYKEYIEKQRAEMAEMAAAEDELAKKWSRGVGGAADVASLTYGGPKLTDAAKVRSHCGNSSPYVIRIRLL